LSDIDIARRLAILMRYRCTALHDLSVANATQELKKTKRPAARTQQRASFRDVRRSIVLSEHGEPCVWVAGGQDAAGFYPQS
jgi:hypothetical protein